MHQTQPTKPSGAFRSFNLSLTNEWTQKIKRRLMHSDERAHLQFLTAAPAAGIGPSDCYTFEAIQKGGGEL